MPLPNSQESVDSGSGTEPVPGISMDLRGMDCSGTTRASPKEQIG